MVNAQPRLIPHVSSLYRGQRLDEDARTFGVPGASLYHANLESSGAIEAGIAGEQRVAKELERIIAKYPNAYVFHSVKIPGQAGDVDHLVVQGPNVILVDSKNWKAGHTYELAALTDDAEWVYRDGEHFSGGEIHMRRQLQEWATYLQNFQVTGILAAAKHSLPVRQSVRAGYGFCNLNDLEEFLGSQLHSQAEPLSYEALEFFALLAENPNFDVNDPSNYMPPDPRNGSTGLVIWSVLNYLVGVLFVTLPLLLLSVIPLLVVTHRKRKRVRAAGLPTGILTATLVFSYIFLSGALLGSAFLLLLTGLSLLDATR